MFLNLSGFMQQLGAALGFGAALGMGIASSDVLSLPSSSPPSPSLSVASLLLSSPSSSREGRSVRWRGRGALQAQRAGQRPLPPAYPVPGGRR